MQGCVLVKTGACASKMDPLPIKVLSNDNHGPRIVSVSLRIMLVMRAIREKQGCV